MQIAVYKILNDAVVEKYSSLSKAAKENNTSSTAIRRACQRAKKGSKRNFANGFQWEFA